MYDNYFEETCPSCDSRNIRKPEAQLSDENGDEYAHECLDCGMQWQHGDQFGWPDSSELQEQSIRDVLCDWGKNPRREEQAAAERKERAAKPAALRENPPTVDEHFPLPWGVHRYFPDYVVPLEDVKKPVGAASDPEQNKEYARVLLEVKSSPRRGITDRMARANALLIADACNRLKEQPA